MLLRDWTCLYELHGVLGSPAAVRSTPTAAALTAAALTAAAPTAATLTAATLTAAALTAAACSSTQSREERLHAAAYLDGVDKLASGRPLREAGLQVEGGGRARRTSTEGVVRHADRADLRHTHAYVYMRVVRHADRADLRHTSCTSCIEVRALNACEWECACIVCASGTDGGRLHAIWMHASGRVRMHRVNLWHGRWGSPHTQSACCRLCRPSSR